MKFICSIKLIVVIVAFIASYTFAEDTLENNPLGLKWGSALQDVQAIYPGGVTWPVTGDESFVNYTVPKHIELAWAGIPVDHVMFSFTPDNKFHQLYLGFNYTYYPEIKQQGIEIFGANGTAVEKNGRQSVRWSSRVGVSKHVSINTVAPFEWVYVSARKDPLSTAKK